MKKDEVKMIARLMSKEIISLEESYLECGKLTVEDLLGLKELRNFFATLRTEATS